MRRYDTDLWNYLKGKTEQSLGISDRFKLAQSFWEKRKDLRSKNVAHRDLKPKNVLLNLTPNGKWNGEIEITDYGIATVEGSV